MQALFDSSDILDDIDALRTKAEHDGYLFIKGLLPKSDVEQVRDDVFAILAQAGWIRSDHDNTANLDKFCVEPQTDFLDILYRQLSVKSFYALKRHSALESFFQDFFGDQPFCLPHVNARNAFPQREAYTTPAHQDIVHFEGSDKTWTCWIPFTDVPAEMGGLAVAAGSHKHGPYDMRPTLGAGQMIIDADVDRLNWHHSPMQMGDVLMFNVVTVHKGVPNKSDKLRVSMDCRWQPLLEPVGEKYLGVAHQQTTWEKLYQGWNGDEHKYYWRDLDLNIEPFQYTWYDRRDERAINMGAAGDPEAAIALENIVLKHRDADVRKRAEKALNVLNTA